MSLASSMLESWDPFRALRALSESHPAFAQESSAFANTRVDWKETAGAHVFKADLPGLGKEDVKVEITDDRILQISGERRGEESGKEETWHCAERGSGRFLRRMRLPEDADEERVRARMEDGVLTVTVAKKGKEAEEEKRGKVRLVEIMTAGEEKEKKKGKKGALRCCGIGGAAD